MLQPVSRALLSLKSPPLYFQHGIATILKETLREKSRDFLLHTKLREIHRYVSINKAQFGVLVVSEEIFNGFFATHKTVAFCLNVVLR